MEKKGFLLIFLSIIFLLVIVYNYKYNYSSLATDSGWDVSYDSGSSGSSDYSFSYDSGSTGSGSIKNGIFWFLITIVIYVLFYVVLFILAALSEKFPVIDKIVISTRSIFHTIGMILMLLLMIFFLGICVIGIFFIMGPIFGTIIDGFIFWGLFVYFRKEYNKKHIKLVPLTWEDKIIVDECYKTFCDVQVAWMNFDYDNLRKLVTDELFNMYQNQLQTLKLKGQKNIMNNFTFNGGTVINRKINNDIQTLEIQLSVSFYDYVIDNRGHVVRGSKMKKVSMVYALTFISDNKALDRCPNCNGPIGANDTICPYCKTNIQGIRKNMKLAKKIAIRQK